MTLAHSDISQMLEVASVAARLAGQRALEELTYIKTSVKNGGELVTQADGICQQVIISRIKEFYPDEGFIGEEGPGGKMLFQPPRTSDPVWWVIDPIDGTNNYAHGLLNFAVSVAAIHGGRPIVGVIYDAPTESMYTAAIDTEAQLNGSRITVGADDISEFNSFGIDSHYTDDMAKGIHEIMRRTRFRNLGSTALHLAYVAKGAMIGTVSTVTKIWDIAAGAILIERAGGVFGDLAGKAIFPMDMNAYTGQEYRILAANKKVYPEVLKMFAVT
ncbi:MAG TPA: inositol monophosphatase [Anaerohalosphaeraceae bacterium]|jgi:myo-inositol-1(or 4)-monophosphatase|nr:inositol monophosphatase [Anaerohalosphaeraceae bacterium]HRT50048.1 inositol monophosphatase [Anaerohalosphaeraceae bacterium]HRT85851.1 inositol monophosphatase [Anaerohalosphaeraceae bacterium]